MNIPRRFAFPLAMLIGVTFATAKSPEDFVGSPPSQGQPPAAQPAPGKPAPAGASAAQAPSQPAKTAGLPASPAGSADSAKSAADAGKTGAVKTAAPKASAKAAASRTAATAPAAAAKPVLDTARIHGRYLDGDFDQAIHALEGALKGRKPLSHADSIFIFKHLGVMYAASPATREKGRYYMLQLISIEPTARILDMYASDMIYLIFRNIQEEYGSHRRARGYRFLRASRARAGTGARSSRRPGGAQARAYLVLGRRRRGGGGRRRGPPLHPARRSATEETYHPAQGMNSH